MKHKTIITLDIDLKFNAVWAARFFFEPFNCNGFKYGFIKNDPIESILIILQEIMNWRTWEPDSIVLFPYSLINADWSALFCNYAKRKENGDFVFSMCGPIEGWFLQPVDPNIVLYTATDNITERISEHLVNMRIVEEFGIPYPDKWDWRLAATISYLYNIGNYGLIQDRDRPDRILF